MPKIVRRRHRRHRNGNGNSRNGGSRNGAAGTSLPMQTQMAVDAGGGSTVPQTTTIDLLNYKQNIPVQTVIESYGWHETLPITQLPDENYLTPLVFRFDGINHFFSHLFGGFLDYDISIWRVAADGSLEQLPNNDLVAPINMCGLTFFCRVELWSGDLQILGFYNDFTDIAYNYGLLYGNEFAKQYGMVTWGWFKDTAGAFERVSINQGAINTGAQKRRALFANSQTVNFIVPVMFDLSGVLNLIPDRADLQLRYYRNSPQFFLQTGDGNDDSYVVRLNRAVFRMKRFQLTASELAHQNRILNSGGGIMLAAIQQLIKRKTFTPGEQNLQFTCFRDVLPSMILLWFTDQRAANGSYKWNPLNRWMLPIKRLNIYKNDIPYPIPNGINYPDERARQNNIKTYFYLLQMLHGGTPTFLPGEMGGGYAIFCFDMTAGNTSNTEISSRIESGTIRIEVDLERALAADETYIMCVQGLFQKGVKISGQREMAIVDLK